MSIPNRPKRMTSQQQCGFLGECQIAEHFLQYGWVPQTISPDIGEDFIVSILDDGCSSGLSFYVQVKSSRRLKKLKNGDYSRVFETKDIQHWEDHIPCVFLCAWDIDKQMGHWLNIADAISQLNKKQPKWRNKKNITLHIPQANQTNDLGLKKIRQQVAKFAEPSIASGKQLTITVRMDEANPQEKASIEALIRHEATGDEAKVVGRAIFPDWFTRLHNINGEVNISFKVGTSEASHPIPYKINIVPVTGTTVDIHYIDMRIIKAGKEEVTLSNKQQKTPFQLEIIWKADGLCILNFTIHIQDTISSVDDIRHALEVQKALATGGTLHIIPHNFTENNQSFNYAFEAGLQKLPDEQIFNLLEMLHTIEQKANVKFTLPDILFSQKDIRTINKLFNIVTTGTYTESNQNIIMNLSGPADPTQTMATIQSLLNNYHENTTFELKETGSEYSIQLFNQNISLGPATRVFTAKVAKSNIKRFKRIISTQKPPQRLKIHTTETKITSTFFNYINSTNNSDTAIITE